MAERALRCEALACSEQNGGSAGRVRSVCWNGMVEAFLNSGTTKTRRQRNGQPRGRWRIRSLGEGPKLPHVWQAEEGRGAGVTIR